MQVTHNVDLSSKNFSSSVSGFDFSTLIGPHFHDFESLQEGL